MVPLTRAVKRKHEAKDTATLPPQSLPHTTLEHTKHKTPAKPAKQAPPKRTPPPRISTTNPPWPILGAENLASAASTAMAISAVTPTYPILLTPGSRTRGTPLHPPKRVRIAPLDTVPEPSSAHSRRRRRSAPSALPKATTAISNPARHPQGHSQSLPTPPKPSRSTSISISHPPRRSSSWTVVGHLITQRTDWAALREAFSPQTRTSPRTSTTTANTPPLSSPSSNQPPKSPKRLYLLGLDAAGNEVLSPHTPDAASWPGLPEGVRIVLAVPEVELARAKRPARGKREGHRQEEDGDEDEDNEGEWYEDEGYAADWENPSNASFLLHGLYPYLPYTHTNTNTISASSSARARAYLAKLLTITHPDNALHVKHRIHIPGPDSLYGPLFVAGYGPDDTPRLEPVLWYVAGATEEAFRVRDVDAVSSPPVPVMRVWARGYRCRDSKAGAVGEHEEWGWEEAPTVRIRVYGDGVGIEGLGDERVEFRTELCHVMQNVLSEGEILVGYDARQSPVWKPIFGLEGYEGVVEVVLPGVVMDGGSGTPFPMEEREWWL